MRKLLLIISILTFIGSSAMILHYFYNSVKNKNIYHEMSEIYYEYDSKGNPENDQTDDSASVSVNTNSTEKLHNINEDIIGWIQVPETNIDYPVVQGMDNDFYLNHDIKRNQAKHGSIFMDYRNMINDQNLIIYGHHMKDGTMFKDLTKFKEEDFFHTQKDFYLDMGKGKERYQIFSVSVLSGDINYLKIFFETQEEFSSYIEEIKKDAYFYRDFELKEDTKLLTLSTCSYEFNNARTVIHAYKVE
jgi:sortase B